MATLLNVQAIKQSPWPLRHPQLLPARKNHSMHYKPLHMLILCPLVPAPRNSHV